MPGEVIQLRPQGPVNYQAAGSTFTQHQDGSETVNFGAPEMDSQISGLSTDVAQGGFSENLADRLTPGQRHALAGRLQEYYRVDVDSRKEWDELTNTALELLGVRKIDVSRLPFPGAAAVQHPVLAEACVQFNSNAIEEFFPPTGPVKGDPLGDVTEDIEDAAERASQYMNYYLTVQDTGYYADKDQSLFYLPVAGSIFTKAWLDPRDQLPRARYIKADDFIAPYFARDLENCKRYCHRYYLEGNEIAKAMALGEFLLINLPKPGLEYGDSETVTEQADRTTKSLHEDDEVYEILEYHIDLNLADGVDEYDDGGLELPYIVVCDNTTGEILSIRRNWKQDDENRKKRVWFAHYKFLPGLGFYGWGFLHVIGSLAQAISGSLRAQLDSALFATVQGGFRAKDGAKKGGSISIQPGIYKDIDASSEELAKTFFTPPYKEPSQALTELFQSMVQDARRFASLTEVLVGQADNKAPVGTTLALIEQSMKLFTAVHKRIFAAAREEFRMLRELIHDFAPAPRYPYHMDGQRQMAMKADFGDHVSFVPVADPNIISDVQRIALAQAILEVVEKNPQLYGPEQQVEAHIRFLKALKVPDWQKLAPKLPQPTRMDPVGENALMMTGKPVRAYPGQRHDMHNQVHQFQVDQARNTLPPDQFQHVYMVLSSHMREHQALQMQEQVSAKMQQTHGIPLPPTDIYGTNQDQDPQMEMAVSILAAQSLPPVPQAMPGSAAAMASGQQPGDPQLQVQKDIQASQAKIEAATRGKEQETAARIDRDTHTFVSDYKQRELEHAQRLRQQQEEHEQQIRQREEEHQARLRALDAETAHGILRDHAKHTVEQRHGRVVHLSALARGREEHEQGLKNSRQTTRESLASKRAARKALNGHGRKKAA